MPQVHWPRTLMPADRGRYPPPAVTRRVAYFPGCRSPRRTVRGRSRHRPASDSMPAGLPLTHARRIAADSCPLAAANPSPVDRVHTSQPGVPFLSRVVSTGAVLISHVLSGPRRLVWGNSSCCGHGGRSSRLPPCRGGGSGC